MSLEARENLDSVTDINLWTKVHAVEGLILKETKTKRENDGKSKSHEEIPKSRFSFLLTFVRHFLGLYRRGQITKSGAARAAL